MSNYDFGPDPDPFEREKREAPPKKCKKAGEHDGHVWGTTYKTGEGPYPYRRLWSFYEATPFFKCPGVGPRTETWKGMKIYFHDDGTVTWAGNKR